MRTLELLKSLSKKELELIEGTVISGKRKSLVPLFKHLKRARLKTSTPDRAELYKKVFGTAYSKNKDYLLRNELRLLNKIIYDHLINSTFKVYIEKSPSAYNQWLLKGFFDRKLKSFFETDIDTSIQLALADVRAEDAAVMLSQKGLWMIQHQPRSIETLTEQLQITQRWKAEEERRFFYRIREAEAREAFIQSVLDNIDNTRPKKQVDQRTAGQTIFDLKKLENSDWLARYLLLKKHSTQTKNEVRIELLKQMLEIEQAPYFKGDFTFNAQVTTLVNLALEHILIDKYEEADKYMQECMKRCELKGHPIPIANIQNCIANQVSLKRFAKGIEIFEKHRDQIAQSRSAENIAIIVAFCHLFLKQPDEAIKLLSPSARQTVDNMVISRLIYSIAFFQRGNYDLANNELANLKRATALADLEKKNDIYSVVLQWVTKYFAAFTKPAPVRDKEISALRKTIKEHQEILSPHLKREFTLLWLVNEVTGGASIWAKQGK